MVNKSGCKKERQRGKESEEKILKEICKKGLIACAKNKKAALGRDRASLLERSLTLREK